MITLAAQILIVEDNPQSLELMSYLLQASGYVVHGAQSGAQALVAARNEPIDLVLLDLQLPDVDGYHVLRDLRAEGRTATTKIIAVTAVAMVGDRERTLNAGFDHYVPKPINPRTFVNEVEAWLPAKCRSSYG
ncbi:response regulator [Rhizocola hellebori]|uniref:Response regulator n=1 Tax=Rhizocola hellebori TaxID=1392758 RepID=A0A8J3VFD2_9ACTN|nr:response regulator [Rhizocola hellebori]GIH03763.1 response regulator [Rhizocola hellebori]